MKGYCLFNYEQVRDTKKLEAYLEQAEPVVKKFGGKCIINGGSFSIVEGACRPTFIVMLEFPSIEKANQWYYSEEYKQLKTLRLSTVLTHGIILEGT